MGSPMRTLLALVVISALVSSAFAVFAGYDGRPRPLGFEDKPTTTLGASPAVKYAGKPANCIWYSWENYAYMPTDRKNCSTLLWEALTADTSGLAGFEYYAPSDEFFDPSANEYLCVVGCFDLSAGGPASPPVAPATPPVAATPVLPPAPVMAPVMSPPAVAPTAPPPMMATPPASLFRPPPPGLPLPPSSIVPPSAGPAQAPGPASQTSAGSAVRIFSGTALFVLVAAVFELVL